MKRLLSQQNGIIGLYRNLMVCDQMYVEMISENRKEILDEMRTRDQMRVMKAMKKYPSVLRTEYVYALLAEQNPKKAEKLMTQFRQCTKSYPYHIKRRFVENEVGQRFYFDFYGAKWLAFANGPGNI